MDEKNVDIPILADLGEPGSVYIGEVERPKRKKLDVIHGADINRSADRNPKYSLPERISKVKRMDLCERLCASNVDPVSLKKEDVAFESKEPVMLMRYSEYRALAPQAAEVEGSGNHETFYN